MVIELNGTRRDIAPDTTVAELVAEIVPGDPAGTAVAVAGEVVRRSDWAATRLTGGDRVEIVHAVQGGA